MLIEEGEFEDEVIKYATGTIFAGGADTVSCLFNHLAVSDVIFQQTVSIIQTFFLAMSLHPEILAKAQEELDTVVGRKRLPTLEDRPNLPYIEAILTEVARCGLPLR
jgi:hypothetical protein